MAVQATSNGQVITGICNLEDVLFLELYPNPTIDKLIIKTEGIQAETITIYDVNGRLVITMPFLPQLDVSGLSSGVYLIEIKSNIVPARQRFVKM